MNETRTSNQSDLKFAGLLCSILMVLAAILGINMIATNSSSLLGIPMLIAGGAAVARYIINVRLDRRIPLTNFAAVCGVLLCGGGLAHLIF